MGELRMDDFNVKDLVNAAWAFATVGQPDEQLFRAVRKAVDDRLGERRMHEFSAQDPANMAYAFATSGQLDQMLMETLAKAAEGRADEFHKHGFVNTAWAFQKFN